MKKYILTTFFILLLSLIGSMYLEQETSAQLLKIECYHCGKKMLFREKNLYSVKQRVYRIYLEEKSREKATEEILCSIDNILDKESDPFIFYWVIQYYGKILDRNDIDDFISFSILNSLVNLSFSDDKNISKQSIDTMCRNQYEKSIYIN